MENVKGYLISNEYSGWLVPYIPVRSTYRYFIIYWYPKYPTGTLPVPVGVVLWHTRTGVPYSTRIHNSTHSSRAV